MDSSFLDNFVLPDGAAEKIKAAGMKPQRVGEGIEFMQLGHDKGVAYRFFTHEVKNEAKSKLAKIPIYDSIEMIEWQPDRFQHPTEQVRFLPAELLQFDDDGECIGGLYKAAYDSWKKGTNAPGLSLRKWGVLSDAAVATLSDMRIYSVEQFAAQPKHKIERLPDEFKDAHEEALLYVNGRAGRELIQQNAADMLKLQQHNSKLESALEANNEELTALREQVALLTAGKAAKASKAKNKKAQPQPIPEE